MKNCSSCGQQLHSSNRGGKCAACRGSRHSASHRDWIVLRSRGFSIAEIARQCGASKSTVCRYLGKQSYQDIRAARAETARETVEGIASQAWVAFDLKPGIIWTNTKKRPVTRARQAVFLVASERGIYPTEIARVFEMDHSTVIHGREAARRAAAVDYDFAEGLAELRSLSSEPQRQAA